MTPRVVSIGDEGASGESDDPNDPSDDTETADSSDADCTLTLLDHQAWTALDAELDPLADHRPDPIECSIAGWYVENDKLEVDTFACNYVALTQPLLEDVEVGDTLALGLYHFDLLAPEPAVAHVAILIDGTIVWQREIEIPGGQMPGPAQVYDETFASPIAAPAGAPLVLHLHNHGQNTWTFDSLTRC